MQTLVTGGTGFVGGAIVEQLVAAKRKVRALARPTSTIEHLNSLGVEIVHGDVLDKASLEKAMAGVDTLYHAAAQYEVWTADPARMLEIANQGTRNVMDAALAAGVKKVLHTSSGAAFGLPKNAIVSEAMTEPGPLPDIYYRSKYESEKIAESYIAKSLKVIFLNPSNVYGPRDNKPLGTNIVAMLNGQVPGIWNANFAIVFVEDVARAHLLAAERGKVGERYLLVERNVDYREFFGLVTTMGGAKMPPFLPVPLVGVMAQAGEWFSAITKKAPLVSVMQLKSGTQGTRFDGSKATRELGLQYTPMEKALEKTIAWYWQQGLLKKKPIFLD
jgi:dihydroflavonol-4-reductase